MAKYKKQRLASVLFGLALVASASAAMAQPPPGRGGPPPEAVDACANLTEGAACSFEGRRGELVEGQCGMPPHGEEVMACMPEGGPPGGGHRPPPE